MNTHGNDASKVKKLEINDESVQELTDTDAEKLTGGRNSGDKPCSNPTVVARDTKQ